MDIREVEQVVLEYLKTRHNGWKWIYRGKVFTRDETINLFEKDPNFRKFLIEEILKTTVDIISREIKGG